MQYDVDADEWSLAPPLPPEYGKHRSGAFRYYKAVELGEHALLEEELGGAARVLVVGHAQRRQHLPRRPHVPERLAAPVGRRHVGRECAVRADDPHGRQVV